MHRYEATCQRLRLFRWLVTTVMEKNAVLHLEGIAIFLPVGKPLLTVAFSL